VRRDRAEHETCGEAAREGGYLRERYWDLRLRQLGSTSLQDAEDLIEPRLTVLVSEGPENATNANC